MRLPYWMTKTYAPELEQDYTNNRWCWYRAGMDHAINEWSVPFNVFTRLSGRSDSITCRSYATKEDAIADLQKALDEAKQEWEAQGKPMVSG